MKRRQFIAQTGSLMLLLGAPHIAWGASMLAVRMWPSKDYTRITIESDWLLDSQQYTFSGPDRFVVDIKGMQLNEQFQQMSTMVQSSDPYVSSIRVGQFQSDIVRIVFDLKKPIESSVFTLEPVAEYKHRLVIDFKPVNDIDPMNQLVSEISTERAQALNEGNQSEADILGDWLQETKDGQRTPQIQAPQTPPTTTQPTQTPQTTRRPTPSKVPVQPKADPTPTAPTTTSPPSTPPTSTPPSTPVPQKKGKLKIIVIDPGHGGEDPGAVGAKGTKEKDIVLSIGKRLRDLINKQPNMRAYMTRDADFFVPLGTRVEKARSVKASLFISIHADAFTNRSAKGASVYALSQKGASSTMARMMADKENQSDLIGGVDVKTRDKQTANILLSMSTAAQIKDSNKLGGYVIQEFQKFAHMHKKSVEHAGFAVLKAPDIPSILVETAFISNLEEEKLLKTTSHQQKLAQGILQAVQTYIKQNPAA